MNCADNWEKYSRLREESVPSGSVAGSKGPCGPLNKGVGESDES